MDAASEIAARRRKALDNFNQRRFPLDPEILLSLSPIPDTMKIKAIQIVSRTPKRSEEDGEPA